MTNSKEGPWDLQVSNMAEGKGYLWKERHTLHVEKSWCVIFCFLSPYPGAPMHVIISPDCEGKHVIILHLCLYFSQPEWSSEEGSEKRRHWWEYQERKGSSVSLNEPLIEVPRSLTTRVPGEKYQNTLLAVTDCLTQEDCPGHGTGGFGAFCFLKDYSWLVELKRHEQKVTFLEKSKACVSLPISTLTH